jgi:hypothetical protein
LSIQLLKEQNKYDQTPSGLLDRLQRIFTLAAKLEEKIVREETYMLEKAIPRMFEVMQRVAKFSCEYVKRGRFGRPSSFLDLVNADGRREDGGRVGPPADN